MPIFLYATPAHPLPVLSPPPAATAAAASLFSRPFSTSSSLPSTAPAFSIIFPKVESPGPLSWCEDAAVSLLPALHLVNPLPSADEGGWKKEVLTRGLRCSRCRILSRLSRAQYDAPNRSASLLCQSQSRWTWSCCRVRGRLLCRSRLRGLVLIGALLRGRMGGAWIECIQSVLPE